jgi:hypothetical protein
MSLTVIGKAGWNGVWNIDARAHHFNRIIFSELSLFDENSDQGPLPAFVGLTKTGAIFVI